MPALGSGGLFVPLGAKAADSGLNGVWLVDTAETAWRGFLVTGGTVRFVLRWPAGLSGDFREGVRYGGGSPAGIGG